MTNQEVYDRIKTHLLTQNKKAQIEITNDEGFIVTVCRYRTPEGLKCAVGCLIEDYDEEFEGKPVILHFGGQPTRVGEYLIELGYDYTQLKLMSDLQSAHDSYEVNFWPFELEQVAKKWNLEGGSVD
jgi:hypothetical protein